MPDVQHTLGIALAEFRHGLPRDEVDRFFFVEAEHVAAPAEVMRLGHPFEESDIEARSGKPVPVVRCVDPHVIVLAEYLFSIGGIRDRKVLERLLQRKRDRNLQNRPSVWLSRCDAAQTSPCCRLQRVRARDCR
jgi:hypothetical protein